MRCSFNCISWYKFLYFRLREHFKKVKTASTQCFSNITQTSFKHCIHMYSIVRSGKQVITTHSTRHAPHTTSYILMAAVRDFKTSRPDDEKAKISITTLSPRTTFMMDWPTLIRIHPSPVTSHAYPSSSLMVS